MLYPKQPDLQDVDSICDETTVACFDYTGSEYDGTNFTGAGVSVNVLRDAKTKEDCNKIWN